MSESNTKSNYATEKNGSSNLNYTCDTEPKPADLEEFSKFGEDADNELDTRQTKLARVQSLLSFFNEKWESGRLAVVLDYLRIYVIMSVLLFGMMCIYWGSMYKRNERLPNLEMSVVVDEYVAINGISIGQGVVSAFGSPTAANFGTSRNIHTQTAYNEIATENNCTIQQQIETDIHHQKYWTSIYVHENATGNLFQASAESNASYRTMNNTISVIYETGRDLVKMNSYVTSNIERLKRIWLDTFLNNIVSGLVEQLSGDQRSQLFSNPSSTNLVSTPLNFKYVDLIPITNSVLVAPQQVGLIYMITLTLFDLSFFAEVHKTVQSYNIKKPHFLLYRILSSLILHFWLSPLFCLVSIALQIDFTKALDHAGFFV